MVAFSAIPSTVRHFSANVWSRDRWIQKVVGSERSGNVIMCKKTGASVLNDPVLNKGSAFTLSERDRFGIRGLVPPTVELNLSAQGRRVLKRIRSQPNDIAKFQTLRSLQDRNETLFYRIIVDNIEEMAPLIYTPTVGQACLQYGQTFRRSRGIYFSTADMENMHAIAHNWPSDDVRIAVITDGSRILGLGDLGVAGMPIPIGKLSLYTAMAGIHPEQTLPVMVDVGTDNEEMLKDDLYMGMRHKRLTGQAYFNVFDQVIGALIGRWPRILCQFEDFNNATALPVLARYREKVLCFNDDIQGTGAVAVAGMLCAVRAAGQENPDAICQQRIVVVGAGSAGIGISKSIAYAMMKRGLTEQEACERFWLLDAKGLLGKGRQGLSGDQELFVQHEWDDGMSLLDVVNTAKPTALIGVAGRAGLFTEEVVTAMAQFNGRPIIFPMSNPTDHAECTGEDAFKWTNGKAIFASGSPFNNVVLPNGCVCFPNQSNNMYSFPGIGLGALVARAHMVTKNMLYASSMALADAVSPDRIQRGLIYPEVRDIRNVTPSIALKVVRAAQEDEVAQEVLPIDDETLLEIIKFQVWEPNYGMLVRRT